MPLNRIIKHADRHVKLALEQFDGLYSKVYGNDYPSIRLGLLSPKKSCAVLNAFVDNDKLHEEMINEYKAISLQRYYKKHLIAYTRLQLKNQILDNKKLRKRELVAKDSGRSPHEIDLESIEVSDVSDSELRSGQNTDAEGISGAEDLQEMFSDRRMDDDEKYFINQASTAISLEDFIPSSGYIYKEELRDDSAYYDHFNPDSPIDVEFRDESPFDIDPILKVYVFPKGEWSMFEPPKPIEKIDLLPYFLMGGASILPVLAMDIKHGEHCADYCAAPGGKALAMLMSLKPEYLLLNDLSSSRLRRLSRVMQQYTPPIKYVNSCLETTNADARKLVYRDKFDKILVDVPCSNDRVSVTVMENNLFSRARAEERSKIPTWQMQMLKAALKSLKPQGAVVYSTCTLSPVENDGVIQRALMELELEGEKNKYAIMNLKEAFRPLRGLFRFKTNFMFGQQVVPSIVNNYGPMFISKIKRIR